MDDHTQPGNLVRWMNNCRKKHRFSDLAEAMQAVPERIQARQFVHFYKVDPAYGRGVKKLGLDIEKHIPWTKLLLKELAGKQPNKAVAVAAV